MSKFRKHAVLLVVGALAFSMATGCSRTPTGVGEEEQQTQQDDTPYTPGTGTGTYDPGTGTGIYQPGTGTGGYPTTPQVVATVSDKKMVAGGFLWLKKKIQTATITVQNPGTTAASGKLAIALSWKGEQEETQELPFNVPAGQTATITVTPKETVDDLTVSVIADTTSGIGTGTGTGYNNGQYNSGTGTTNGYY